MIIFRTAGIKSTSGILESDSPRLRILSIHLWNNTNVWNGIFVKLDGSTGYITNTVILYCKLYDVTIGIMTRLYNIET